MNLNSYLPASLAKATIVSHETRALFDFQEYHQLNHPIILPAARLGSIIKDQLKNLEILDYGLTFEDGSFIIGPNGCRLQWPLTAAYALAVATIAGASKIKLVGFDGYDTDYLLEKKMNEVIEVYETLNKAVELTAITPTSYKIKQGSIFSPEL